MFHFFDLDTPISVGLCLLLSQSFDDGHGDPKDRNPAKWNGQSIDDVLNIEFVGIALQDVDSNLQGGVDKGVNNHAENAQDNQGTREASSPET